MPSEFQKANHKGFEVNTGNALSRYQPEVKFEIFHVIQRLYA